MRINRLQIFNFRLFEHAGLDFQQGMNLLMGENGSGKSIILDALRISLSRILPRITASRSRPIPFVEEDIRAGSNSMAIDCSIEFQGREFTCSLQKSRSGRTREQFCESPCREGSQSPNLSMPNGLKEVGQQPLGIFFPAGRLSLSNALPTEARVGESQDAAFAGALSRRSLYLREIALWMESMAAQRPGSPLAAKQLSSFKGAVESLLPGDSNLMVEMAATPRLLMDREGKAFDLGRLSGGEFDLFALVIDLARRLVQANHGLLDPVREGHAVVMIDELELHLHPKRQRTIVSELTKTFPNCQFIATTHSPQILSSVQPEQVFLLKEGKTKRPVRTLGMDSNWILSSLMETDERSQEATAVIEEVEAMMKEWDLETARDRIAERRREGFDLPYWSVLEARMARMEDLFEREP